MIENAKDVTEFLIEELLRHKVRKIEVPMYLISEYAIEQIALKLWGSLPPIIVTEGAP